MSPWDSLNHDIIHCEKCPRLRTYCQRIAVEKRKSFASDEYWGRPVANFGDPRARLLLVGLAPAAHGANRTGRMFTGDRSGEWLYRALHKSGLGNKALSLHPDDGLKLKDCAITAVCHCAPPDNKPTPDEIKNCTLWLERTVEQLPISVFVTLGQIAWNATFRLAREKKWFAGKMPKFGHLALVPLSDDRWVLGSFHPSQQNTFTGRLTEPMFDAVFAKAKELLGASAK